MVGRAGGTPAVRFSKAWEKLIEKVPKHEKESSAREKTR